MPAIHGKSHQALKYFREKPAALAVYWIYVSRANYENVAFPSVSGLGRDTGWNRDTCAAARRWLVEHGALELVEKYVRPKWRDLPEKELKAKLSFDRSEYYRPTGKIVIDGTVYNLLYFGGDETSNIEEELTAESNTSPDVPPGRLSNGSTDDGTDGRRNGTELDSIGELDSKELNVVPEKEEEKQPLSAAAVFRTYEVSIGGLTPILRDTIQDWLEEVPAEWIVDAINEAVLYNKRSWAYAEKIIKRWQSQGKDDGKKNLVTPKWSDFTKPDAPTVIEVQPDFSELDKKLGLGGSNGKR